MVTAHNGRYRAASALTRDVVLFVALLSTALALGAALAHAFELPNKIDLPRDEYFIAQKLYRGWNQLAYLLLLELVSMVAAAVLSRRQPRVMWFVIASIVFLAGAQAVFWAFTFPANAATENWTAMPENWEALRRQWEYSHAVGAGFQLLAMSSLIFAALVRVPTGTKRAGGGRVSGSVRGAGGIRPSAGTIWRRRG